MDYSFRLDETIITELHQYEQPTDKLPPFTIHYENGKPVRLEMDGVEYDLVAKSNYRDFPFDY